MPPHDSPNETIYQESAPDVAAETIRELQDHIRAVDGAWERALREAIDLYPDDIKSYKGLKDIARGVPGANLVVAHMIARDGPRGEGHDPDWEHLEKLARGERMRPLFPDPDDPAEYPHACSTGVLSSSGLDWLELTDLQDSSGRSFMKALGIPAEEWTSLPTGLRGYRERRICGGVTLLTGGTDEMGAHLIVSGDGARELEARDHLFSWQKLARTTHGKYNMRCGRLDVFRDERDGELSVDDVREKLRTDAYTSRSQDWATSEHHKHGKDRHGNSVTVGSRMSERYLRVYDKCMELAPRRGKLGEREKWIQGHGPHTRFELEHKDKVAEALWAKIAEEGLADHMIAGLLGRFIMLKDGPAVGHNANRVKPWEKWLTFLKNAPHVVLAVTYRKTSIPKKQGWLEYQAAVSMWQLWCMHRGDVSWIFRMIRDGSRRARAHHFAQLKTDGIPPGRVVGAGEPWTLLINRDQLAA